jgi:CheY-like chemotaxis protein
VAAEAQRAADAVGTFELVPSFVPSVIFFDIAMLGMDGYEVARRLRRMPEAERSYWSPSRGSDASRIIARRQRSG